MRRIKKALICEQIQTKPDYAEPLGWSCHLLKMPPLNEEWTEPLKGGTGGYEMRPSMLEFGREKNVGKCL